MACEVRGFGDLGGLRVFWVAWVVRLWDFELMGPELRASSPFTTPKALCAGT